MSSFGAILKNELKDNAKAMGKAVATAFKMPYKKIKAARARRSMPPAPPPTEAAVPHVTSKSVLVVRHTLEPSAAPVDVAEIAEPFAPLIGDSQRPAYVVQCPGKDCECCQKLFRGSPAPDPSNAREWQDAFETEWPIDDNRRWLVDDSAQVEETGQPMGMWRRAGPWFLREFSCGGDWRAACHKRWDYAKSVRAAIDRGAKGFVPVADEHSMPGRAAHVKFGNGPVISKDAMHARIASAITRSPPGSYVELQVAPKTMFEFAEELDAKLVSAFLELSTPDEACCSVEDGNRYDWFWPHVAQLGQAHMLGSGARERDVVYSGGPRSFFSDGSTVVTCRADGAFGIATYAFGSQFRVVMWGALVASVRRDMPRALNGASAKFREKAAAPAAASGDATPAETIEPAFAEVANNATNWTFELLNP